MSITLCNIGRHEPIAYDNSPEVYIIRCPLCEALDEIDLLGGIIMKITCNEFDGCFGFFLDAENMKDAAFLVRFGTNYTIDIRNAGSSAVQDGSFKGWITLGKRKNPASSIQRPK
jgi:hypothetical protein